MELLLQLNKYGGRRNGEGLSSDDIAQIIKELPFEGEKEISESKIEPKGDASVIQASILGITNVFLLGNKIDKGIADWIGVAKRIKYLVKTNELVAIDSDGAALLALEFIFNFEELRSIQKTSEQEIALVDVSAPHGIGDDRKAEDLIVKPYNYYIFSFLINNEKHFITGVKPHGEVNLIKCFDACSTHGTRTKITPQNSIQRIRRSMV